MSFNDGSDYMHLRSGMVSNEGMPADDPNVALLSDYLSGEMVDADRAAFERRLETDATFFNDVMPMIELVETLRENRKRPSYRVSKNASERFEVAHACALVVDAGGSAVVATPIGEIVVRQGAYEIECTGAAEHGQVVIRSTGRLARSE